MKKPTLTPYVGRGPRKQKRNSNNAFKWVPAARKIFILAKFASFSRRADAWNFARGQKGRRGGRRLFRIHRKTHFCRSPLSPYHSLGVARSRHHKLRSKKWRRPHLVGEARRAKVAFILENSLQFEMRIIGFFYLFIKISLFFDLFYYFQLSNLTMATFKSDFQGLGRDESSFDSSNLRKMKF